MTRALHIVLVEPEIAWNTGNLGRTSLAVGAELDVISDPAHATVGERLARAHDLAVEQGAHAVARSILTAEEAYGGA